MNRSDVILDTIQIDLLEGANNYYYETYIEDTLLANYEKIFENNSNSKEYQFELTEQNIDYSVRGFVYDSKTG
jgi:ABC-type thiamine transport system substrate-binding protein